MLEIGDTQGEQALELAAQFFTTADVRADLVGRPRVLVALNPA